MTKQVTIRCYEDRDHDKVIEVVRDLQRAERLLVSRLKTPEDIGADYMSGMLQEVAKHRGCILVAESEGEILGYCSLLTHCDSSEDLDEVLYTYAYVADLGVVAHMRSRGIGARLIEEAENVARREGLPWLRLSVLAPNASARRFYQRHGFAENLILLEKRL